MKLNTTKRNKFLARKKGETFSISYVILCNPRLDYEMSINNAGGCLSGEGVERRKKLIFIV